jgi:carbon-monoxide dehydrogenase large subunit
MENQSDQGHEADGAIPRIDARRFVDGSPIFVADLIPEGCLRVALLRSPHPKARIVRIDASAAIAASGVRAVVTGDDLAAEMTPIPPALPLPHSITGRGAPLGICLAQETVNYVGQPVVAVVATNIYDAQAALDLIEVEYEPLPHTESPDEALAEGAPIAMPGWETNLVAGDRIIRGDTDSAFASAAFIAEGELDFAPSSIAPMETCSYTAAWDPTGRVILTGTLQNPHTTRWMAATALGVPESAVRVITPPLGGSFGLKMAGHPEEVLVCALARRLRRTVNFTEERWETLLAPCRAQRHQFRIAADAGGKVVAFENRFVADVGCIGPGNGWSMPMVTAAVFPTLYDVANVRVNATLVATNKIPWQPVRGYGKEIANLVMEQALDRLAARMGLDPVDIRRRNLLRSDQLPRKLPSGLNVDSGDYPRALDDLEILFGYDKWKSRRHAVRNSDRVIGLGIGLELTPEGGARPGAFPSGFETATIRLLPTGQIQLSIGVTSPGSGNETGLAQLAARELGVPPTAIEVIQGDTDRTPVGTGNASSRALLYGGPATVDAARALRAKIAICVGNLLSVHPDEVHFQDGEGRAGDQRIGLREIAMRAYTNPIVTAKGTDMPLEATASFQPSNVQVIPDAGGRVATYSSFPYSFHAAAIELDRISGSVKILDYACVHDCGVVVNPMLVTGQLRGAIVMGIGAALWETLASETAQPLHPRFKEYLLPRALDLPPIRVGHLCTPSPFHPLGMKGAGESGVGGALAALTNAVTDALGKGCVLHRVPATPMVILDAMQRGDT